MVGGWQNMIGTVKGAKMAGKSLLRFMWGPLATENVGHKGYPVIFTAILVS